MAKKKSRLGKLLEKGLTQAKAAIRRETQPESIKKRITEVAQNELYGGVKRGAKDRRSEQQKSIAEGLRKPGTSVSFGKTFDISESRKGKKQRKKIKEWERTEQGPSELEKFMALEEENSPAKKGSGSRARKKHKQNIETAKKKEEATRQYYDELGSGDKVGLKDIAMSAAGAVPYLGMLGGAGKIGKAVAGLGKKVGGNVSAGVQGVGGAIGEQALQLAAQTGVSPEEAAAMLQGGATGGAIGVAKNFAKGKAKNLVKAGLKKGLGAIAAHGADVAGAAAKGIGVLGSAKAAYDTAKLYNKYAYQNMTPEEQAAFRSRKSVRSRVRKKDTSPLNFRGGDLLSEETDKFGEAIPLMQFEETVITPLNKNRRDEMDSLSGNNMRVSPLMDKGKRPVPEEGESPDAFKQRIYEWLLEKARGENPYAFKNIERIHATKSVAMAQAEQAMQQEYQGLEYEKGVDELEAKAEDKYAYLEDQVDQAGDRYEAAKAELEANAPDLDAIEDKKERKAAEKAHKQALKDLEKGYNAEYKELDKQIGGIDKELRVAKKDAYRAYSKGFKEEKKLSDAHVDAVLADQKALTEEAHEWRTDAEGMKEQRDKHWAKQARKMKGTDSGSNQQAAAEARAGLAAQHQQMAAQAQEQENAWESAQDQLRALYAKRGAEFKEARSLGYKGNPRDHKAVSKFLQENADSPVKFKSPLMQQGYTLEQLIAAGFNKTSAKRIVKKFGGDPEAYFSDKLANDPLSEVGKKNYLALQSIGASPQLLSDAFSRTVSTHGSTPDKIAKSWGVEIPTAEGSGMGHGTTEDIMGIIQPGIDAMYRQNELAQQHANEQAQLAQQHAEQSRANRQPSIARQAGEGIQQNVRDSWKDQKLGRAARSGSDPTRGIQWGGQIQPDQYGNVQEAYSTGVEIPGADGTTYKIFKRQDGTEVFQRYDKLGNPIQTGTIDGEVMETIGGTKYNVKRKQ